MRRNEPDIFATRFWRDFYRSMLSNAARSAMTKRLSLVVDADRIEALSADRAALWERVTRAPFLTVNEKRASVGYGAVAGGDVFAGGE